MAKVVITSVRLKLSLCLVMGALLAQGAFAQRLKYQPFRSDPTIAPWAREAVDLLGREEVVEGYYDGTFKGNQTINRYDAAWAIGRFVYKTRKSKDVHADLTVEFLLERFAPAAVLTRDKEDWRRHAFFDIPQNVYCWGPGEWIRRLSQEDILVGYPSESYGVFRGKDKLTRFELAVLVSRLVRRVERERPLNFRKAFFKDVSGGEWSFGAVLVAVGTGVMEGYPDRTFRGDEPVTRNELAVVLARLMKLTMRDEG